MTPLRDATRRRLDLNPITTSIHVTLPSHLPTPSTALSPSHLNVPFNYNPAIYTPVSSTVRQYNPQQWSCSPSINAADSGLYSLARTQEGEVVAPAPPPYSPPRTQPTSVITHSDPGSCISPASRISPAHQYRSSPEPAANPSFPPPPPPPPPHRTRTRAGSRSSDRPPSLFNISSFARRSTPEAPRLTPEAIWDSTVNARRANTLPVEAALIVEDLPRQQVYSQPPASRRAASAGALSTPSTSRSRGSSTSRWEPGMPLPPPPPGPPPPSTRSQSMSRSTDRIVLPLMRRPDPASSLGPVPPTPAGWVDDDSCDRGRPHNREQYIDMSITNSGSVAESNSGSGSSGLMRAHAVRGEPKTIRERRTESKSSRSSALVDEPSSNSWAEATTLADIVVPPTVLGSRSTITRSTPRSGRSYQSETPTSANDSHRNTPIANRLGFASRGSTPGISLSSSRTEATTPPFSPGQLKPAVSQASIPLTLNTLPTPRPQSRLSIGSPGRPVSHIFHIPNDDSTTMQPLVPSRPGSCLSTVDQAKIDDPAEQFASTAIERHRTFAEKEARASSDTERVRIFAEFIVSESRLRRDRYASAINAMGSEILDLTRDLFRPHSSPRSEPIEARSNSRTTDLSTRAISPLISGSKSHHGSAVAALNNGWHLSSLPTSGSEPTLPVAAGRPEFSWSTGYMPSLSPIPSMSVSEALDGSDSRGRPSSRWWEVSEEINDAPSMRLERSKREAKYMGMPRELQEALQYENGFPSGEDTAEAGSSMIVRRSHGEDEYPAEKVGWHEDGQRSLTLRSNPYSCSAAPFSSPVITTNSSYLDMSRLVTLPPPYPRHYPAVNNNHPDLVTIRTQVRALSDLTDIEAMKTCFHHSSSTLREKLTSEAFQLRHSLRCKIQHSVETGSMTYAEAAALEATATASAAEKENEAIKNEFKCFQTQVVVPLNNLLMDRVHRTTELFTRLSCKLFVNSQQHSPNLIQEEGDEQPELLEQLTLLKWIFEAREQLHQQLYDLVSDRNERYKKMIIASYRLSQKIDQEQSAERFFAEDAEKRQLTFEQETLKRTGDFMDIIEENVIRGVEVQLSAFWDIAPSLSVLIRKVPTTSSELASFHIQIPAAEYEENPSYHDFPLQYLSSLLGHCEKSTYQFIESQINLLCLLHEVKTGVTSANCRVMRCQRVAQGEAEEEVRIELHEVEKEEERRLTDDLKEKVRCVEELWGSALGFTMGTVREGVKQFLMERGGWDEEEEERERSKDGSKEENVVQAEG